MTGIRTLPLLAILAMIGCSGGGSDGYAELTLTEQNAQTVAAQGVGALAVLEQTTGMVDGFSEVFGNPEMLEVPCSSGQAAVTINDMLPEGELSTGDSASISFMSCGIGLGSEAVIMSGSVSFVVNEASGSEGGPFSYSLTVSFDDFSMALPGGSFLVDGGFTMAVNSTDGTTLTSVVNGDYLTIVAQGQGITFSGTLSEFREVRTYNNDTWAYSYELQATVASSLIGGKVVYHTTAPFTGVDPDAPDTGSMDVTGADGGILTINAMNSTDVQLVLDSDADGTPEATINTTWAYLDSVQ